MILFEEKNNMSFSRYLDFWIFGKSTTYKTSNVIIEIASNQKLHFLFFRILNSRKMKFS